MMSEESITSHRTKYRGEDIKMTVMGMMMMTMKHELLFMQPSNRKSLSSYYKRAHFCTKVQYFASFSVTQLKLHTTANSVVQTNKMNNSTSRPDLAIILSIYLMTSGKNAKLATILH